MARKLLTLCVCLLLVLTMLACYLEGYTAPEDEAVWATGEWLGTRIVEIQTVRAEMTAEAMK
jgi:hypothetical protein